MLAPTDFFPTGAHGGRPWLPVLFGAVCLNSWSALLPIHMTSMGLSGRDLLTRTWAYSLERIWLFLLSLIISEVDIAQDIKWDYMKKRVLLTINSGCPVSTHFSSFLTSGLFKAFNVLMWITNLQKGVIFAYPFFRSILKSSVGKWVPPGNAIASQ